MNPFVVLNVSIHCTDAEVRAAYHALLRRYPPEQRPDEFQMIQEAYQSLRSERDRWTWRVLNLKKEQSGPIEILEKFVHLPGRCKPPGAPAFRDFLKACSAVALRDASSQSPKQP